MKYNAIFIKIGVSLAIIGLWQVFTFFVPAYILPSPLRVAHALLHDFSLLYSAIAVTLFEALSGFVIAVLFACVLALAMHTNPRVKALMYPPIIFSQAIPIVAFAPLFVLWFGFGYIPKIITVVLICFFPITVTLTDGLAAVSEPLINMMKTFGASRASIIRHVQLPSAMGHLFAGMKISVAYSIMAAVIGEWLGGDGGIGVYMIRVQRAFALDKMCAAIIVIIIATGVLFAGIRIIQRILLPWSIKQ